MIVVYSLAADTPIDRIPYITGGGLDDRYEFHSFHLHWGSDSSKGSEHLIRSQRYHVYWFSYSTTRLTNPSRFFLILISVRSYPAELHLVHYNTKYGTFAEATTHPDGLAVLGIFLKVLTCYLELPILHTLTRIQSWFIVQVGLVDNEFFQPLVDQLSQIPVDQQETILDKIVSFQNLLPQKTTSFFRYSGSLTTPNCNEIVTWTVFENPIRVSERQVLI